MAFPFYSSITDSVMVVMNVSGLTYLDLCMRSSGVFIDVIHGDVDVASTLLCAPSNAYWGGRFPFLVIIL